MLCVYVFECFEYSNVASRVEGDQALQTKMVGADCLTQESMVVGDYKSLLVWPVELVALIKGAYTLLQTYNILVVGYCRGFVIPSVLLLQVKLSIRYFERNIICFAIVKQSIRHFERSIICFAIVKIIFPFCDIP